MISAWCLKTPYLDHLVPVWKALPEDRRGSVYVSEQCLDYAERLGLAARRFREYERQAGPLVIFSRAEFRRLPTGSPVVFIEHGVGANYDGRSHLAAITSQRAAQIMALLTTPAQAEAHRRIFGDRVHEVGCPKLDAWAGYRHRRHRRHRPPVVAFSHHWDQRMYPETRSAWPWDAEAWEQVIAGGRYTVLGHKHPGDPRDIEGWCREHGIEFVERFDDVLRRADLYVADNTSTLYEFAATGRPVVVLSPPWYRRDVHHGARFWEHLPGLECAIPDHLEACIAEALEDVPARRALRELALEAVYGPLDGRATERAVAVLLQIDEMAEQGCWAAPPGTVTGRVAFRHIRTGRIRRVAAGQSRRRAQYERNLEWERL